MCVLCVYTKEKREGKEAGLKLSGPRHGQVTPFLEIRQMSLMNIELNKLKCDNFQFEGCRSDIQILCTSLSTS